ncbi:MAG: hypothetical protein ACI4E4_02945 [Acetatifactor sp.]
MVRISKPKIEHSDGTIRFYVDVFGLEQSKLWYEMPDYMEPYLDLNDSTAFLVALLPQLCIAGEGIVIDGSISSVLYYNIIHKLYPLWRKYSSIFNPIEIQCNTFLESTTKTDLHAHYGTGISCGVDSLDAIKTTMEYPSANRIDTLTFFNTGSHRSTGGLSPAESRKLFYERMERSKQCAKDFNLNFLWVDSNVGEFIKTKYVQVHQFCNFSAVLACGSYFEKYYYASGYPIDMFSITHIDRDTAYYETYLCSLLSTEKVRFLISGECKARIDKVKNIADMPIAQKYLNVCFMEDKNCGTCEKCVRTQMELYAIGKLDSFSNVFDIEKFYKNIRKHYKRVYCSQYSSVYMDIINEMRNNGISVPFFYKLYGSTVNVIRRIKRIIG